MIGEPKDRNKRYRIYGRLVVPIYFDITETSERRALAEMRAMLRDEEMPVAGVLPSSDRLSRYYHVEKIRAHKI